jgi:glycosyltransferase involved in cell wall biosynthesis
VSDFLRQKYLEAGWRPDRIRVKHNFAWASPRRFGAGEFFLYLGRLTPEKGVHELLRAWTGVSARLLVVGEGPQADQLQSDAPQGVDFRGIATPSEVVDLLGRARALLVPSTWYEGQPRVILEAYAAGVPVIASRLGGVPELVEDGTTGFLVEPTVRDEWRNAISRMQDEGESTRLGEGAFYRWRERYSPQHALEALEANYTDAMRLSGIR